MLVKLFQLQDILENAVVPAGCFVNDTMIVTLRYNGIFIHLFCVVRQNVYNFKRNNIWSFLYICNNIFKIWSSFCRYLLSVNSHGVVTCALDFLQTLTESLPLFTLLYMKIMLDKIEAISVEKVAIAYYYQKWLLYFQRSLDYSLQAHLCAPCSSLQSS